MKTKITLKYVNDEQEYYILTQFKNIYDEAGLIHRLGFNKYNDYKLGEYFFFDAGFLCVRHHGRDLSKFYVRGHRLSIEEKEKLIDTLETAAKRFMELKGSKNISVEEIEPN